MTLSKLATKYRPQTFDEVVGHELSVRALKGMVESRDIPTGMMLSGASGTGKTTIARIIANELGADVVEVDAASHGGVADIRKLNESLRYSTGSAYKILILDEAHSLTRDAFNALLKSLEEAPEGIMYLLITTDPLKVPKTVRTRLTEFEFRPLVPVEILTRLVHIIKAENLKPDPDLVKHIATHSDGSARTAITSFGKAMATGITSVAEFLELSSEIDVTAKLVRSMVESDIGDVYDILDSALLSVSNASVIVDQIINTLKELLVLKHSSVVTDIAVDFPLKQELSKILASEKIFASMRILWDLKTQVKSRGDRKTDVELAVALLYDVINR